MLKQLPEQPSLDHLRDQAKKLLSSFRSGNAEAVQRIAEFLPAAKRATPTHIALHDAQSALAREYGFESWPKLVIHVEEVRARAGITQEVADSFVEHALSDRVSKCVRLLQLYPGLPKFSVATTLVSGEAGYIRKLLDKDPKFVQTPVGPNGWRPLEYVCYSRLHQVLPERYEGLLESASILLQAGADPNSYHLFNEDRNARLSALYGAAGESGHAGIVRLLLKRGAEPNDGESTYHAAEHNRSEILESLVEFSADISSNHPRWGNSPLFFLCGYRPTDPGYETVLKGIEWLLEHGADPNVPCKSNHATPLHAASRSGGTRLVDLLLQHEADPLQKNSEGRTPFELATLTGNQYAADALRRAGGGHDLAGPEAFIATCVAGDMSSIDRVLAQSPLAVKQIGEKAGLVFCKLAEFGVLAGVKGMLHAGFSPSLKGEAAATPLHFACFCGQLEVVRVLLESGAPLDVRDCDYNATPLGWALHAYGYHRSPNADYPAIIRALLGSGASTAEVREFLDNWEDATPESLVLLSVFEAE